MAASQEKAVTPARTDRPTPAGRSGYLSPFDALRSEIDDVFDRVFGGWPFGRMEPFGRAPVSMKPFTQAPRAEMTETDKAYTVAVELPGIDDKDVQVSLEGEYLMIKGEKKLEHTDEKTHFTERSYGSFERVFRLPDDANPDGIEAKSAKGVLTLTIPKLDAPPVKGRKIDVKPA